MADEALKCIAVAKKAINEGDLHKAAKFLKKSINFERTDAADELLVQVESQMASKPSNSSSATSTSTSNDTSNNNDDTASTAYSSSYSFSGSIKETFYTTSEPQSQSQSQTRRRPSSTASPSSSTTSTSTSYSSTTTRRRSSSSTQTTRNFTPEQQSEARRVNALADYYEILSITKTATDVQIKAAYRKMALKFHPDKNQAPEAEEAFKKVSEAYTCLSNAQEREFYDRHGSRAAAQQRQHQAHANAQYYREDVMTPEDLFRMFFDVQTGRRFQHQQQQRHRQRQQHQEQQGVGLAQLMQFLPILLLLVFSFLSSPGGDDTPFSLDRASPFTELRHTSNHHVPFYMSPHALRQYARDHRATSRLESVVEQAYMKRLDGMCRKEQSQFNAGVARARNAPADAQPEMMKKAQSFPMPSCERLHEMRAR